MKDELNKKIRELCNSAGSSAACAMAPVLTEDLDRKYDERVAAGMSELDAYRDVLRSVDRIEAMLRALPKDSPKTGDQKARDSKSQDQESRDPKPAPKKKAAGTREAPPCVRPSTPEEEEAADLAADANASPSLWARVPPCSGWGRPFSISSGPSSSADGSIRG